MLYIGIFIFKIIEDALATLRLIVVSNGKKVLGSILQFIVTVIWVILTGTVLINFTKDLFKVIAFSFGSLFGSYLGSFLEEKIALGTNSFTIKTDFKKSFLLLNKLRLNEYSAFRINNDLIMVTSPRKRTKNIIKIINSVDNNAIILSEKTKDFSSL